MVSVAKFGPRRLTVAQEIVGSNPTAHPKQRALVAQRIEHRASDPGVAGSNPAERAMDVQMYEGLRALILCTSQ
jgi:hypothetical protein